MNIQSAWSRGDLAQLKRYATPEMLSYFRRGAVAQCEPGLENRVENVKLLKGDLLEAWQEDGSEYATTSMHWTALDYKLKEVKGELRRRMHQPIPVQGMWLRQVVTGFFGYHAVPTNFPAVAAFRLHVARLWRRTLRRRSPKDGSTWKRIERLADDFLPKPRVLHPWPSVRFAVKHPPWEPYVGKPHVRICAGASGNGRPYRDPTARPRTLTPA